ncbi:MAG: SUMF1/EgtB/PvdO family nonheme iron enzyme [Candidatus Cloacimonetes bacterium]|nr:SUMF1/EgtB/PvdO family nonheme iron enzyme [Candidatus Cloacimonadota bacterium]
MNANQGENAYTIIETLHRSQQFRVYKARNYFSGRIVTIKTNERSFQGTQTLVEQLRNEAETGRRLKHPNIRETIGLFEDGGSAYMVCEYLEGDPLDHILAIPKVDISYSQALKWTLQILDALQHAHQRLILHLNLHPSKMIITTDYELKIFGFGRPPHAWKNAKPGGQEYHPVIFTAPEIFLEQNPDQRSDIYSVGVLAHLLFTGRLPWEVDKAQPPSSQKQNLLTQPPVSQSAGGKQIPAWLRSILGKALQLDPQKRFSSAEDMRAAIVGQKEVVFDAAPGEPARYQAPETQKFTPDEAVTQPGLPKSKVVPTTQIPVQRESGFKKPLKPRKEKSPKKPVELSPEMLKLRKTFKVMAVISALILVYILFKYVIFNEKSFFKGFIQNAVRKEAQAVANRAIEMIPVNGGTALLGNVVQGAGADEYPVLQLELKPFMIGVTEVTREEWAMVFPSTDYRESGKDLPITGITFDDVLIWCNKKSLLDGLDPCYEIYDNGVNCDFSANGYRLPTEAEWEFAAKAGKKSNYFVFSGANSAEPVAWFFGNSGGKLQEVKQKQPNQFGIHDLSGNAAEWVWNWYAPYGSSEESAFAGPDYGSDKVVRGGSFKSQPEELRVTRRDYAKPYAQEANIGFRVVRKR